MRNRISHAQVKQAFVNALERFGPLPEAVRAELTVITSETRGYAAKTDFDLGGKFSGGWIVIVSGFACRYKVNPSGARQIVTLLLPGDICNFDTMLPATRGYAIATLSQCEIARVPLETSRELAKHPALSHALRMTMLVEMANAREWIVNVGTRDAVERVAHLLCELYARLEAAGLVEDHGFDLPLIQPDLADTVGISNVHLNRSLKILRNMKLIEIRSRRLIVLDFPGLKAEGDFQPDYLCLETLAA